VIGELRMQAIREISDAPFRFRMQPFATRPELQAIKFRMQPFGRKFGCNPSAEKFGCNRVPIPGRSGLSRQAPSLPGRSGPSRQAPSLPGRLHLGARAVDLTVDLQELNYGWIAGAAGRQSRTSAPARSSSRATRWRKPSITCPRRGAGRSSWRITWRRPGSCALAPSASPSSSSRRPIRWLGTEALLAAAQEGLAGSSEHALRRVELYGRLADVLVGSGELGRVPEVLARANRLLESVRCSGDPLSRAQAIYKRARLTAYLAGRMGSQAGPLSSALHWAADELESAEALFVTTTDATAQTLRLLCLARLYSFFDAERAAVSYQEAISRIRPEGRAIFSFPVPVDLADELERAFGHLKAQAASN